MDPLSITASGIAVVTLCAQVAGALRTIIEAYKGCPEELSSLLSRAEGLTIQLRRLDAIRVSLSPEQLVYLSQAFDEAKCTATVIELRTLVANVQHAKKKSKESTAVRGPSPVFAASTNSRLSSGSSSINQSSAMGTIKWLLNKENAGKLVQRLKDHQQDLFMAVSMISMEASLGAQANTQSMVIDTVQVEKSLVSSKSSDIKASMDDFLQSISAISAFSQRQHRGDTLPPYQLHESVILQTPRPFQSWMGSCRALDRGEYYQARQQLSNAAYGGDWDRILTHVEFASTQRDQDWINCIRLVPAGASTVSSGYTPLHQAAWHGTSVNKVKHLIQCGAWRTLRTIKDDCTPLEIAKKMRHQHLYEILSPVIRHPLPPKVSMTLENALHRLITRECSDDDRKVLDHSSTRYPELSVLTEMRVPILWFPLREDTSESRGFMIRLDKRELVVKSPFDRQFRISEKGKVQMIEEAVIFSNS